MNARVLNAPVLLVKSSLFVQPRFHLVPLETERIKMLGNALFSFIPLGELLLKVRGSSLILSIGWRLGEQSLRVARKWHYFLYGTSRTVFSLLGDGLLDLLLLASLNHFLFYRHVH